MIGDIGEHQKEDILRLKKTQMKETLHGRLHISVNHFLYDTMTA